MSHSGERTWNGLVQVGDLEPNSLIAFDSSEKGVEVRDKRGRFTKSRFLGKVSDVQIAPRHLGPVSQIRVEIIARATTGRKYFGELPETPETVLLSPDYFVDTLASASVPVDLTSSELHRTFWDRDFILKGGLDY